MGNIETFLDERVGVERPPYRFHAVCLVYYETDNTSPVVDIDIKATFQDVREVEPYFNHLDKVITATGNPRVEVKILKATIERYALEAMPELDDEEIPF